MDIYQRADEAIREMNRWNLRAFNGLKLAKWDGLHVIRQVNEAYDESIRRAKRKYYEIAVEAYIVALLEAHVERVKAHRMADEAIDMEQIMEWLEDVDPVTMYAFFTEAERKKARFLEAASVAENRNKEIDRALKYWSNQLAQYADNSVFYARLKTFKDAGVEKVMWNTQRDERVCDECGPMDGEIFEIDSVPTTPHWGCRCYLTPVID